MKKVAVSLILLSLFAAAAQAQTVSAANIVGYKKLTLQPGGKYYLASCNFQTGTTNTLLSIFGTDKLTQDNSYVNCDRIFVWNSATQTYQAWAQWTDGVFYKANNLAEWNAGISGNPVVPLGTGFFISSGNVSNTLIFSGDAVQVETKAVPVTTGYQIMGFPFSSDIALQNTSFFASGAAADNSYVNCDRVHVWTGSGYQAYAVWTDGVWYKANNLAEWNAGIAASNTISMGEGFFYEAKAPITWNQSNPYYSNIR